VMLDFSPRRHRMFDLTSPGALPDTPPQQ